MEINTSRGKSTVELDTPIKFTPAIRPEELRALDIVEQKLDAGNYIHHLELDDASKWDSKDLEIFNMGHADRHEMCGTACCIGGWMAYEIAKFSPEHAFIIPDNYVYYNAEAIVRLAGGAHGKYGHSQALHYLFFPNISAREADFIGIEIGIDVAIKWNGDAYTYITPKMAAQAIRNFKTYGEPRWVDIIIAYEKGAFP